MDSDSSSDDSVPEWRIKTGTSPPHCNFRWNTSYRRYRSYPSYHNHDFSGMNSSTDQVVFVKDINWSEVRPLRAGIIIYTKQDMDFLFCLGVDTKSGELTDFAGGISYRRDKDALTGALREFSEESHGIFGSLSSDDLKNCRAIYDETMMIIFLYRDINDIQETLTSFLEKVTFRSEICELVWVNIHQFRSLLSGQKLISGDGLRTRLLYRRVQNLINSNGIDLETLP